MRFRIKLLLFYFILLCMVASGDSKMNESDQCIHHQATSVNVKITQAKLVPYIPFH